MEDCYFLSFSLRATKSGLQKSGQLLDGKEIQKKVKPFAAPQWSSKQKSVIYHYVLCNLPFFGQSEIAPWSVGASPWRAVGKCLRKAMYLDLHPLNWAVVLNAQRRMLCCWQGLKEGHFEPSDTKVFCSILRAFGTSSSQGSFFSSRMSLGPSHRGQLSQVRWKKVCCLWAAPLKH